MIRRIKHFTKIKDELKVFILPIKYMKMKKRVVYVIGLERSMTLFSCGDGAMKSLVGDRKKRVTHQFRV